MPTRLPRSLSPLHARVAHPRPGTPETARPVVVVRRPGIDRAVTRRTAPNLPRTGKKGMQTLQKVVGIVFRAVGRRFVVFVVFQPVTDHRGLLLPHELKRGDRTVSTLSGRPCADIGARRATLKPLQPSPTPDPLQQRSDTAIRDARGQRVPLKSQRDSFFSLHPRRPGEPISCSIGRGADGGSPPAAPGSISCVATST